MNKHLGDNVQTFLPYPDFKKTAEVLDWKRLGKQRVEALQILNSLNPNHPKRGWRNHPAVKMWKGYENALRLYLNTMIREWVRRGYNNTMKEQEIDGEVVMPPWFGAAEFHSSHRANLLRKDSEYYEKFGWTEDPEMEYVWPVR